MPGVVEDVELIHQLVEPGYKGQPERAIVFTIEAWDANCPQHIVPRYTEEEVAAVMQPLHDRITELEAEKSSLTRSRNTSIR